MPKYRITCDPVYVFKFSFVVDAEDEDEAREKIPVWSIGVPVSRALAALGATDIEFEYVPGDDEQIEELEEVSI